MVGLVKFPILMLLQARKKPFERGPTTPGLGDVPTITIDYGYQLLTFNYLINGLLNGY